MQFGPLNAVCKLANRTDVFDNITFSNVSIIIKFFPQNFFHPFKSCENTCHHSKPTRENYTNLNSFKTY